MVFSIFEKQLLNDLGIQKIEQASLKKLALILACSGGTDSLALLFLLLDFKKKYAAFLDIQIIVAHFNHQMRVESEQEAEQLAILCQKLKITFEVENLEHCIKHLSESDQKKMKAHLPLKKQRNLYQLSEEAARDFRYLFLERLSMKYQAMICLAHHIDDQAESLLLHLKRGCGLQGLCAMKTREGNKLRPLLNFRKVDLEQDLKARSFTFLGKSFSAFQDITNDDVRYQRNYIRHHVLPCLAQHDSLNHITQKLADLSQDAQKIQNLLKPYAQKILDEKTLYRSQEACVLERNLKEDESVLMPFFLQTLAERYLLEKNLKNITRKYYEQLVKAFNSTEAKKIIFKCGYIFFFEFNKVYFCKEDDVLRLSNQNRFLIFNEETVKNATFHIDYIEKKLNLRYNSKWYIYSIPSIFPFNDLEKASLRSVQKGDRYVLHHKTQDIKRTFEEQKIPKSLRNHILCFAMKEYIIFLEDKGEINHV